MKLKTLQALRALACLLVVSDHLPRLEAKLFPHGLLAGLGASGAIGVDLFFVISGFIMIVTTRDAFGTPGAGRTFLERRVLRIYPPYWIATLAFIAASTIAPALQHAGPIDPWSLTTSLLLVPQPAGPIMFVAWSLEFEMYFYLAFTFALSFARERLRYVMGAWIVLTLACNLASLRTANPLVAFVGSPLAFEFMVGVGIGILVLRGRTFAPRTLLATGAVLTVLVAIYSSRYDGFGTYALDWYRVLAATPGMALIVYGAVTLEERFAVTVPVFFVRLGDASYTTYLWHGMLLGAFTAVVARLHPHGVVADIAFVVCAFVVVVAGSQLIYRIVELPLLRLLQRAGAGAPRRRLDAATSADAARSSASR